jgi:hypothetical protein
MGATQSIRASVWDGYIYELYSRTGDYKTGATEPVWANFAVNATITDNNVVWIKRQHSLEGYVAGDILSASVWDLWNKPLSGSTAGMAKLPSGKWTQAYFYSGTGANSASVYGATITYGLCFNDHLRDLQAVGLRLPSGNEFTEFARGSAISWISTQAAPATAGGAVDLYGRRLVSNIGCEQVTGCYWTYISDYYSGAAVVAMGGTYDGSGGVTPGPYSILSAGTAKTAIIAKYAARGVCDGFKK